MQKSGKVLIVDDEPISVATLQLLLVNEYEVLMVSSGEEAIKVASEMHPDVILLDIVMPEMDGYEVFRRILDNPELCDIPVLFITAMGEEKCEIKGLDLGAHDYLTKPYNAPIVRLRVKNHIEFKRRSELIKKQRDLLSHKNVQLEAAMARIKKLEGILTVCMYCKQVRNDKNSWEQMEKYITDHSEARFSHGICPDCMNKHHGDMQ